MLRELIVQNIVLIERLHISFSGGLCVLTGETGAGKSILLDALALSLGEKANINMVRANESQGSVSAVFDISANDSAKLTLNELGISANADELITRRVVFADGKSKAFINDEPVSQQSLKKLAVSLIEIHGQHDQQGLMDTSTHKSVLDAFGELEDDCEIVRQAYEALQETRKKLAQLKTDIEKTAREEEYLRHMNAELRELAPKQGEEEVLSEKRSTLMQAEKLKSVLDETMQCLSGKEVVSSIRSAHRILTRSPLTQGEKFKQVIEALEKALDGADSAVDIINEIGREIFGREDELERLEDRLFALRAAARKYNLPCDELATLALEVVEKLLLLKTNEGEIKALEMEVKTKQKNFLNAATILSEKRKHSAAKLEKEVLSELKSLKMENTCVSVEIKQLEETSWNSGGIDAVQFMVATNVVKDSKNTLHPINKIASGGELSRFMLALKVAFSHVRSTPSLIFDEIDTGTGGAVADAIGKRLAILANKHQVFVVTHLPQVAARGNQHLVVTKNTGKKGIVTNVAELNEKERTEELARMLAGAEITDEARKAAKKLMEQAA